MGRCSGIPAEWEALVGRREDYRHLYLETPGQGAGVTWSENAGKLKVGPRPTSPSSPTVPRSRSPRPSSKAPSPASARPASASTRRGGTTRTRRSSYWRRPTPSRRGTPPTRPHRSSRCGPPGASGNSRLSPSPPAPCRRWRRSSQTRSSAAAPTATRSTTPPTTSRRPTSSSTGRAGASSRSAARSRCRAAVDAVNSAMYDYLRSMLGRSGGGGGGPSLNVPDRALRAYAWAEFVREMRNWRVVSEGGGSSSGGGGLTVDDIQEYVRDNDALRPLLREAGGGRRGPAAASARGAPAERPGVPALRLGSRGDGPAGLEAARGREGAARRLPRHDGQPAPAGRSRGGPPATCRGQGGGAACQGHPSRVPGTIKGAVEAGRPVLRRPLPLHLRAEPAQAPRPLRPRSPADRRQRALGSHHPRHDATGVHRHPDPRDRHPGGPGPVALRGRDASTACSRSSPWCRSWTARRRASTSWARTRSGCAPCAAGRHFLYPEDRRPTEARSPRSRSA